MPGERDLETLLRSLRPVLDPAEFVFATRPEPAGDPVCVFREREGLTLILRRAEAERLGIAFTFPCRMITLEVHSSLDAIGLLARVSSALAARGIAANPVSGYFHDHLFVPSDRAEEAMAILLTISSG
jgi:uncharacterized protein